MSFRKTVDFTTLSRPLPAALSTAEIFFITCSVCSTIPPATMLPVAGSSATCPEAKTNPADFSACEYGPIACGAPLVATCSFMMVRIAPGIKWSGSTLQQHAVTVGEEPVPLLYGVLIRLQHVLSSGKCGDEH